jgi:hypothetical protein
MEFNTRRSDDSGTNDHPGSVRWGHPSPPREARGPVLRACGDRWRCFGAERAPQCTSHRLWRMGGPRCGRLPRPTGPSGLHPDVNGISQRRMRHTSYGVIASVSRCALRRHQLAFALEQVDPAGDNRTCSTTALVFAPFERTPSDVGSYSNNGTQRDPIGSPFCVNLRHRSLLSITSSAVTSSGTFREVGSAPQAVADNVISLPLLGT